MSAEVVTAAMVFWNPETIRTQWEASAAVTPRAEASEAEALTNRATDRDYAVFPEDEAAEFVALAAAAVAESSRFDHCPSPPLKLSGEHLVGHR